MVELTVDDLQELTEAFLDLDEVKNYHDYYGEEEGKIIHVDVLFELASLMSNLHPDYGNEDIEATEIISDIESVLETIAFDYDFAVDSGCGYLRNRDEDENE